MLILTIPVYSWEKKANCHSFPKALGDFWRKLPIQLFHGHIVGMQKIHDGTSILFTVYYWLVLSTWPAHGTCIPGGTDYRHSFLSIGIYIWRSILIFVMVTCTHSIHLCFKCVGLRQEEQRGVNINMETLKVVDNVLHYFNKKKIKKIIIRLKTVSLLC